MDGIGHNRPPTDAELLRADLEAINADLLTRRDDLIAGVERAPEIVNADNAGGVSDFIKQITAAAKHSEASRKDTKEPYLAAGRVVDGFYKAITDPLDKAKKDMVSRLDIYMRAKADAERRAREEEARRAAEEARKAEAALAAQAEAEAALAKAGVADTVAPASEVALDDAIVAQERAVEAAKAADAKPAELSRTRGDYGSVATMRTSWTGDLADRATLDLESLRQHISEDALGLAIRSFVRAGGRELAGAKIYERQTTVVA